jgi:hypothetical protein
MCAFGLVLNAVYFAFARRLPKELQTPTGKQLGRRFGTNRRFTWFSLASIPAAFWLITCTQVSVAFHALEPLTF